MHSKNKPIIQTGLILLIASCILTGCPTPQAKYVDPSTPNTLNTDLNMNDIRSVADSMVKDLINTGVLNDCKNYTVSEIKNKTDQYGVDTQTFGSTITAGLAASPRVRSSNVVASYEMKNQVSELDRQQDASLYDQKTTARKGQMLGADCRIDGYIDSNKSTSIDNKKTNVSYEFNLQVINVAKGRTLWQNRRAITKTMKRY